MTTTHQCDDCKDTGIFLNTLTRFREGIQRCDQCQRYDDDTAASEAVRGIVEAFASLHAALEAVAGALDLDSGDYDHMLTNGNISGPAVCDQLRDAITTARRCAAHP